MAGGPGSSVAQRISSAIAAAENASQPAIRIAPPAGAAIGNSRRPNNAQALPGGRGSFPGSIYRTGRTLTLCEPLAPTLPPVNPAVAAPMLKERRRHVRHTINRVAKIQSAAGSLPRDCLVTDISESGARLYAEGIVVPDSFVLVVTGTETIRRDCRVSWRLGNEIGVEFVGRV
jgi:hypothetical protein